MARLFSGGKKKKKKNHQYLCVSQRAHCKAMQCFFLLPPGPASVSTAN